MRGTEMAKPQMPERGAAHLDRAQILLDGHGDAVDRAEASLLPRLRANRAGRVKAAGMSARGGARARALNLLTSVLVMPCLQMTSRSYVQPREVSSSDGRHAEAGRKAHGRWRHRRLLRAARTHPGTEALRSLLILLCAGGLLDFLFGLGGGDHLGRRVVGARGRGVSSARFREAFKKEPDLVGGAHHI